MKVFLATNNNEKIERFKKLLKHVGSEIKVYTPGDLNIDIIDVAEIGPEPGKSDLPGLLGI